MNEEDKKLNNAVPSIPEINIQPMGKNPDPEAKQNISEILQKVSRSTESQSPVIPSSQITNFDRRANDKKPTVFDSSNIQKTNLNSSPIASSIQVNDDVIKKAKQQIESNKLKLHVQEEPQKQEQKTKTKSITPKFQKKLLFSGLMLLLLLIPIIPRQVGGETEIEGSTDGNQAMIRPSIGGVVSKVYVKTGQSVKAGEPIAEILNWDLDEKLLNAESQLHKLKVSMQTYNAQELVAQKEYEKSLAELNKQRAESNYVQSKARSLKSKQLTPELQKTQKQLEQTKLQSESLSQKAALHKYLSDEGVFPKQSALQSAYEAASAIKQAQALEAQLQYEKTDISQRAIEDFPKLQIVNKNSESNLARIGVIGADKSVLEYQVADLEKQVELMKAEKAALTLKSPIDGLILTLKTSLLIGQNLNRGDILAVISNLSEVKVKVLLPEEERAFIKIGQTAKVRVRAVPNRTFEGKVTEIAPITSESGTPENKRRIWEINISLKNPVQEIESGTKANLLLPGMTGFAKIQTDQRRSMLGTAWDEMYKAFRLDRYIDRNPLNKVIKN